MDKPKKGFAAMDPAAVAERASKGGKAAHAAGKAYRFTPEKAREAGRKGGQKIAAKKRKAAEERSS